MMTRQDHAEWMDRLSEYLDGDLSGEESAAVEAHLAGCGPCRRALAELRQVVARARALGPAEPARDLWPGIAAGIGAPAARGTGPDVLPFPRSRRAERVEPRRRWALSLTAPQLATAAAALVLLSVSATWWAGAGVATRDRGGSVTVAPLPAALASEGAAPPAELAEELAALEAVLAGARTRMDPNTVRLLERNLGVIQRAIDESVRALGVDPGNEFVRSHLERAWREKADFLREASFIMNFEG